MDRVLPVSQEHLVLLHVAETGVPLLGGLFHEGAHLDELGEVEVADVPEHVSVDKGRRLESFLNYHVLVVGVTEIEGKRHVYFLKAIFEVPVQQILLVPKRSLVPYFYNIVRALIIQLAFFLFRRASFILVIKSIH